MDKQKLETIRNIAIKHVLRYTSACPSSATCRHRRKRGKSRKNEPCTHELHKFTRFVEEVMQGGKDGTDPQKGVHDPAAANTYAFDLTQAAIDAALIDLQIERCSQRQATYEASIHKAMKANRPASAAMRTAAALRAEVRMSMTLIERKQKLIDKCQKLRSEIYKTYSPEDVSLARVMQEVMNLGRQDFYDSIEYDENDPVEAEQAKTWTMPGDPNPRPPPNRNKNSSRSDGPPMGMHTGDSK